MSPLEGRGKKDDSDSEEALSRDLGYQTPMT